MNRILIDIGHPGHVHLFKHLAHYFINDGDKVLFTVRDKECELALLEHEEFDYVCFGKHYKTLRGKIWGLVKFDTLMLKTALQFRPDVFLSHGSIYAAHTAAVLGKPHMSMEDSGNMEQIRLYRPFTDTILTSDIFDKNLGPKQKRYNGYHELAYLHPNRFSPCADSLKNAGIDVNKPYALLRFISWNATHDRGQKGLDNNEKYALVKYLNEKMDVYISAEVELPTDLEKYQLRIQPPLLHDLLSCARIVISEGATIAAEAAVLGTPSAYVNSIKVSYCTDLERYGLLKDITGKDIVASTQKILHTPTEVFQQRRRKMLAEKIDVTAFLINYLQETYLTSKKDKQKSLSHAV